MEIKMESNKSLNNLITVFGKNIKENENQKIKYIK